MKRVVDGRNAHTPRYRKVIEHIEAKGVCPFCPKNFKYHTEPVLKRRGSWFITKNFNPYPSARHHFIVIGTAHHEQLSDLTSKDFAYIGWLLKWAERTYRLQGGAFAMRFGNTRYTGATIVHLHCHLIVPRLEHRTVGGRRQRLARLVPFPIG